MNSFFFAAGKMRIENTPRSHTAAPHSLPNHLTTNQKQNPYPSKTHCFYPTFLIKLSNNPIPHLYISIYAVRISQLDFCTPHPPSTFTPTPFRPF